MNISEFDSSEFDYLNAGIFLETENQNQPAKQEISNIERFWRMTGNWGEFGSYRGRGSVGIPYRAGDSRADTCCCNSYSRCWFGAGGVQFGC
jgi:glutaredoxin-related protein